MIRHVTDLAVHETLGIRLAAPTEAHILELAESKLVLNHLETVHAGVQFILAEACSGEFLLQQFSARSEVFAVLRTSTVKFHKAARGPLRASAELVDATNEAVMRELESRQRAFVTISVR